MNELGINMTRTNFQRNEPFPDERKGELFEIVNEIMDFSIRHHDHFLIQHLEKNLKGYTMYKGKDQKLEFKHHMFWWLVFCHSLEDRKSTIFQEFIKQNWLRWKYDSNFLEVLLSWVFIHPGFYSIVDVISERELIIKDLLNGELKPVTVYNESFTIPEQGDLLSGLLLSYCDGTYSPIFDFLIIPKEISTLFTQKLFSEFNLLEETSFSGFFRKNYGNLLSFLIPHLT